MSIRIETGAAPPEKTLSLLASRLSQRIRQPLLAAPFVVALGELDFADFPEGADMRAGAGTDVQVANAYDAQPPDGGRQQREVRSHQRVLLQLATVRLGDGDWQIFGEVAVGFGLDLGELRGGEPQWLEIDACLVGVELVADRSRAVELVDDRRDEMLRGVHLHVRVAPVPVNAAFDRRADLGQVARDHVPQAVALAHVLDPGCAALPLQFALIGRLPAAERVERRAVQLDDSRVDCLDHRRELARVGALEGGHVQLLSHGRASA